MERTSFTKIVIALALVLCLGGSVECLAQSKPLWINKSETSLNKKRISDNYTFKVFNTHDFDEAKLKKERLTPLMEYLQSEYGFESSKMTVDTTAVASDGSKVTKVSMPDGSVVYAKLVDDYSEFADYELNVFQYEYYQLYAVTNKDAAPEFDEFKVDRANNTTALTYSLIPGVGQLYKGQKAKAYVIMGAEVLFVASAIEFEYQRHHASKNGWRSKARGWREFRDIAIVGAVGVYVYNLIDAATAKGGTRLSIGKQSSLAVLPWTTGESTGVSLALNF